MIIFGTTGRTKTIESGSFSCPQCQGEQVYDYKTVRRWFTLYFIPCIPMGGNIGEYIECRNCSGTFTPNALSYDPGSVPEGDLGPGEDPDTLFLVACKQVMIAMLLADGRIDDEEVTALQDSFELLSGVEITEQDLREEIAHISRTGSHALDIARKAAPNLNDAGKEMLMKQAYLIAAAGNGGSMAKEESRFFDQLAQALELSRSHMRGILLDLGIEIEPN